MEKLFRRVLFEGEEHPKINIICDTLYEGLRAEFRDYHNGHKKNIIILHSSGNAHIDFGKNPMEVYSPYIPHGIAITMNFENSSANYWDYDEIIYMQPYPFTLHNVIHELDDADKLFRDNPGKKYKIMFYRDINQHSSEGDLVGIDQALEEAPMKIRSTLGNTTIAKSMEFCIYRTPMDFIHILHGGCGNIGMSLLSCIERFKKFRTKLEEFKSEEGDYKFILEGYPELNDETKINNITKYKRVKGCSNIIRKYTRNYADEFHKDITRFIDEVYHEAVKDVCFWDLDKDIESLKKGAEKYIEQELLSSAACKEKCPDTEAEYNSLIRVKYSLDTKFVKKVRMLIDSGLMNFMYDYLKQKEELLSKPFSDRP